MDEPRLISGGLAVDERGQVSFCNDFNPLAAGIKRLYLLHNHQVGYVRAWHGHHTEAKYVLVTHGTALVCCVPVEDLEALLVPRPMIIAGASSGGMSGTQASVSVAGLNLGLSVPEPRLSRFVLSAQRPQVLYIPPGYANGHMALTVPCDVLHFSTMTLEEAAGDDLRFPARCIPWAWEIEER